MVASGWQQFMSQLRRNWLQKVRSPWKFAAEFFVPVLLMFALAGIKTTSDPEVKSAASYSWQSMNVPSLNDLMVLPLSANASSSNDGVWYLKFANLFVDHGASNIAYSCSLDFDTTISSIQAFDDLCEMLKWVSIPMDDGNSEQAAAANEFRDFILEKYPESSAQERFNLNGAYIGDNSQLDDYISAQEYGSADHPRLGAAIVFETGAPNWKYYIRVNKTASYGDGAPKRNVPETKGGASATNNLERGTTKYTQQYMVSGFLTLQQQVDSFILSQKMGNRNVTLGTSAFPMPTAGYSEDPFWASSASTLGLFMLLAALYPLAATVQQLVQDKETKVRELMFIMGLRPSAYTWSWVCFLAVMFFVLAGILTGVTKINLFELSDGSVILVYFLLFFYASIAYAFFIAAFFERATLATVVALLIFFIGYFLFLPLNTEDSPLGAQLIVSLIPSAAFSFGTLAFSEYEGALIGITWDNVARSNQTSYTLAACFGMLIFDTLFYMSLALYFDAVIPSSSGAARKKWYNPFGRCGRAPKTFSGYQEKAKEQDAEEDSLIEESDGYYQQVPRGLRDLRQEGNCVMVNHLVKTYKSPRGDFNAVDDLTLTFFENQITVFLGHNGAGKSTTLKTLIGLQPPSSGDFFIGGKSGVSQMNEIRQNLGYCPQHDILFPNLTVQEHFTLFAGIKGVAKAEQAETIRTMIAEVGLAPKTNVKAKALSGGMKRKLQLGIALFGNPSFILCDEPTSGIDVSARVFCQRLLLKYREGRTIVVTTHYMDEADVLGDRIAILSKGKLRCVGTSLFLKKKFGVGYQMVVEHENAAHETEKIDRIGEVIKQHVPEMKETSRVGTELIYQLPLSSSPEFQPLLEDLDSNGEALRIINKAISVTTLETVFLRVAEGKDFEDVARAPSSHMVNGSSSNLMIEGPTPSQGAVTKDVEIPDVEAQKVADAQLTGLIPASTWGHVGILFRKRMRYARRDRRAFCCQLLIPLAFLLLGFITMKINVNKAPDAYEFGPETNDWNVDPDIPNIVPYNLGNGSSVSANATNNWMENFVLPRLEENQKFQAGPTETYCIDQQYVLSNFYSSWRTLKNAVPNPDVFEKFVLNLILQNSDLCGADSDYNASTLEFSNQLSATRTAVASTRYGSLLFDVVPQSVVDGVYNNVTDPFLAEFTIGYNFTALHAVPLMLNRATESLLKLLFGETIVSANWPFGRTKAEAEIGAGFSAFSATLAIGIAFAFVPSAFAVFIVREKDEMTWHQQIINGVKVPAYWMANWIFDFVSYLFLMVIAFILIYAFDLGPFTDNFGAVAVIFILYGIVCVSFTYLCSSLFSNATYAQLGIILLNLLGGMVLLVVAFILFFLDSTYVAYEDVLRYIFPLMPPFAFAHGLLQVANIQIINFVLNSKERGGDPSDPVDYGVWHAEIAGIDIAFLAAGCVGYTLLLVFVQWYINGGGKAQLCSKTSTAVIETADATATESGIALEDADVLKEKTRVEQLGPEDSCTGDDIVLLKHTRKVFKGSGKKDKVAVADLSFGVKNKECFGLLGVNGAGKSTTIECLTASQRPTAGQIYVGGKDILKDPSAIRGDLGYCPQFDGLWDLLTGREHLQFFGGLKGIPADKLNDVIDDTAKRLSLTPHIDKLVREYSGGNKRKLSVAIATLGFPKIVICDEASAGLDAKAQRDMWGVIEGLSNFGCTVIITSHSMEEISALCNRITIMVDGRMRCLGTAQHLKDVYGSGYEFECTLRDPTKEEIAKAVAELGQQVDSKLHQDQIKNALEKLGPKESAMYEAGFTTTGSANLLLQQLHHGEGTVSAESLADWLLLERSFQSVQALATGNFEGTKLSERQGSRLRFNIPSQESITLAQMFGIIEQGKEEAGIEGYSLGQSTLESVFNYFAATQSQEED